MNHLELFKSIPVFFYGVRFFESMLIQGFLKDSGSTGYSNYILRPSWSEISSSLIDLTLFFPADLRLMNIEERIESLLINNGLR